MVLLAAGASAFAAVGGSGRHAVDVAAANARTARASSVHYAVAVTLSRRKQPMTLHIVGGASRDRLAVLLRLEESARADGTKVPGTTATVRLRAPFVYERAPAGLAVLGKQWLRFSADGLSERSQILSRLRSMTPSPLLRVVAEARLRPTGTDGAFAGVAAYDDPVVQAALASLSGGLQIRGLRVAVRVGRDGLVHRVRITGRTADGRTTFRLRAYLYDFGRPVLVVPPKPGTFMDPSLERLKS